MTTTLSSEIPAKLLNWFDRCKRVLPWRRNRDPYRIWLSEIMLQQTRVGTVISYFNRFTEELPTVQALADAEENQLMRLWEGLGYYRRMRMLHQCAEIIVTQYSGRFPGTAEELQKLPGIGKYTSGAIASIAFEQPEPAVDGNVLRVLSRLTADNGWDAGNASEALKKIYPAGRCGDFTQSLMELGAIVCLPNGEPLCKECPLSEICKAYAEGKVMAYPAKTKKTSRPVEKLHVYLLRCKGKIAVRKRPDKGLLSGMWEFPNLPEEKAVPPENFGRKIRTFHTKHIFTHREWDMTVDEIESSSQLPEFSWLPESECILPAAFRKLLKNLHGSVSIEA